MTSSDGSRLLPTEDASFGGNEFDDLFDFEDENDPFNHNFKPPVTKAKSVGAFKGQTSAGLGIDEEVEITRKSRAPRVKLDENRLLSANGIPKLRKKSKHQLQFKGRGHEYSDASKLLSFYQLWLDDLFPKARFVDALGMVEKMGHKKVMQTARVEWINEGKTRSSGQEDSVVGGTAIISTDNVEREATSSRLKPVFEKSAAERTDTSEANLDAGMEELYDATPRPTRAKQGPPSPEGSLVKEATASTLGPANNLSTDDGPPEDDLSALLAEEALQAASRGLQPITSSENVAREPNFDEELEVMAEMDGLW